MIKVFNILVNVLDTCCCSDSSFGVNDLSDILSDTSDLDISRSALKSKSSRKPSPSKESTSQLPVQTTVGKSKYGFFLAECE